MQILKAKALEKTKEKNRQSQDPNLGLQPMSMFLDSSVPHIVRVQPAHHRGNHPSISSEEQPLTVPFP